MRILIYGINYSPELTGIGKYTGEMGAWLAGRGHEVNVITALPYYPEWAVHTAYEGKGWQTENVEGATVHRSPLYVPRRVSAVRRMLHEFSFVAGSFPYWLRALVSRRHDVVICVVPAFHLGFFKPAVCPVAGGTNGLSHPGSSGRYGQRAWDDQKPTIPAITHQRRAIHSGSSR